MSPGLHPALILRGHNQDMRKTYLIGLVLFLLVIAGGYYAFEYLKDKPRRRSS